MADAVHHALCPRVAVLCDADADRVAQHSGAQNVLQLLRAFEESVQDVTVRTSQLELRTHATFPLRFDALHAFAQEDAPLTQGSLDAFLDTVQAHLRTHAQQLEDAPPMPTLEPGADRAAWDTQVRTPPPWCTDIAAYLYRYRPMCAYDTFAHPLALLLVVSASSADPMNAFAQLYNASCSSSVFAAQPHVERDLLRTYLLVHDAADPRADWARSQALLEEVRRTYGLQCALLSINSGRAPDEAVVARLRRAWDTPDVRAAPPLASLSTTCRLSAEDVRHIHAFLREFVVKSLVPYLERSVQQLNEQVGASRRGLAGRLLGAGRKLFTTRAPSSAPGSGYDAERNLYPAHALPAQTRRLADLALHVCDYRLAADMYDAVRRDYEQDGATSYTATATEMLSLARLLHGSGGGSSSSTGAAQAPALYATACALYAPQTTGRLYALRATFLYGAVQRARENGAEVAAAYLHAATFTDEVLRGVCLELAALAYLSMPRPHIRKSAATLLRSAEQFDACGQKAFALRCYRVVAPYYKRQAWPAMADYVLGKLAHQAHNSGDGDAARAYAVQLLYAAPRTATHDRAHLERLLAVHAFAPASAPITLPTHVLDAAASCIDTARCAAWDAQLAAHGLTHLVPRGAHAVGIDAPFTVRVCVRNPLQTPLTLTDLRLELADANGTPAPFSAAPAHVALAARETRQVAIHARVPRPGTYRIAGAHFLLEGVVPVHQALRKRGARRNATHAERVTPTYAPDTTLAVQVRDALPTLRVDTAHWPTAAYVGQTITLPLAVHNTSVTDVHHLQVHCTPAHAVLAPEDADAATLPVTLPDAPCHTLAAHVAPGASIHVPLAFLLLTDGATTVECLFVYQNAKHETFTHYVQHTLEARPLLQAHWMYRPIDGPAYLAVLHLQNAGPEVTVDGLALRSPQWQSPSHVTPLRLAPNAQGTLAMHITRAALPADATVPHACAALAPLFAQSPPRAPALAPPLPWHTSALLGTCPLSPAVYRAARATLRKTWIDATYAFLPSAVRRKAFLFAESNEVDVLVTYTLADGTQGCLLLYGARIGLRSDDAQALHALRALGAASGAPRAMYAATAREQARMHTHLLHSPLGHLPAPIRVAAVVRPVAWETDTALQAKPVALEVHNTSVWPLTYTLRLFPPRARATAAQPIAPWIGRTVHRGSLAPWSHTRLTTQVVVAGQGAYQLGDWACDATHDATGLAFSVSGRILTALVVQAKGRRA